MIRRRNCCCCCCGAFENGRNSASKEALQPLRSRSGCTQRCGFISVYEGITAVCVVSQCWTTNRKNENRCFSERTREGREKVRTGSKHLSSRVNELMRSERTKTFFAKPLDGWSLVQRKDLGVCIVLNAVPFPRAAGPTNATHPYAPSSAERGLFELPSSNIHGSTAAMIVRKKLTNIF